jgi:hypothetical protein
MKFFLRFLKYLGVIVIGMVLACVAIQSEEKKTGKPYFCDNEEESEVSESTTAEPTEDTQA